MLLVTGATGFVGRTLLPLLESRGEVRLLARDPRDPVLEGLQETGRPFRIVRGDLADPTSLSAALEGVSAVAHLAARTGKARRSELLATNATGTRALLEASRRAGVRAFVLVSSIAATYPDKRRYPYAESKERAEELVRASGLPHAILRPTVVLGPGSPVGASLRSLAALPLVPVFGDGRAPVQPVHVADVARALLLLLEDVESGRAVEGTHDLGGPEAVPFEELLLRLSAAVRGEPGRALHVPVGMLVPLLAAVEPLFLPLMPVTAGQLSAFVNDGRAREGDVARRLGELRGLDEMIAATARSDGAAA